MQIACGTRHIGIFIAICHICSITEDEGKVNAKRMEIRRKSLAFLVKFCYPEYRFERLPSIAVRFVSDGLSSCLPIFR